MPTSPQRFAIVNTATQPKPAFSYKIFLDCQCYSARDYSEEFNHGSFIGTTDEASAVKAPVIAFVNALINGGVGVRQHILTAGGRAAWARQEKGCHRGSHLAKHDRKNAMYLRSTLHAKRRQRQPADSALAAGASTAAKAPEIVDRPVKKCCLTPIPRVTPIPRDPYSASAVVP